MTFIDKTIKQFRKKFGDGKIIWPEHESFLKSTLLDFAKEVEKEVIGENEKPSEPYLDFWVGRNKLKLEQHQKLYQLLGRKDERYIKTLRQNL